MARDKAESLSEQEISRLWELYRQGHSCSAIGRLLGRSSRTLDRELRKRGGFSPAKRSRHARVLSLQEREEISRGVSQCLSHNEIARRLGRAPSTVNREIKRNGGSGAYRALNADQRAWQQAARPKACLLSQRPRLCRVVSRKLMLQWSPQQISRWLSKTYASDDSMRVSHETIYRSLFIQARGVLKKQLIEELRRKRMGKLRRGKTASNKGHNAGQIVDAVSISERPAEAADRAVPGHWEGDLIAGSHGSHIATLVERRSRFVMLVKITSRDSATVVNALSAKIQRLPIELTQSLTWDRGKEMARHKAFTLATDVPVYFCDPHSPWQRGTNENTNLLLRQYFPKGTDLSVHSQAYLNKIAKRLNERPRQTLDYETPADTLYNTVATTL